MSSKNLFKFLATSNKVASVLDWKKKIGGSILAIDIGRDRIGVAVASHPSFGEPPHTLKPITMKLETMETVGDGNISKNNDRNKLTKQKSLAPEVIHELQDIVKGHNICGYVISWPVQKEGRCGAPCGRVLHTIDSLLASSSTIFTPSRLFCLWDGNHITPKEDVWGRCPAYGESTTKTSHIASHEQYNYDGSSVTAAKIWNDYCMTHWPELYQEQSEDELGHFNNTDTATTLNSDFCSAEWLEHYEDASSYMNVANL